MSKRLIYGKEITIKGDNIIFTSTNPVQLPSITVNGDVNATGALNSTGGSSLINSLVATTYILGSGTVSGQVRLPPENGQPANTGLEIDNVTAGRGTVDLQRIDLDSTSARVTTAGATMFIRKLGNFVEGCIRPAAALSTPTAADNTGHIAFTQAMPAIFRPLHDTKVLCYAVTNNIGVTGSLVITAATGAMNVFSDANGANFTSTQLAAIGDIHFSYCTTV